MFVVDKGSLWLRGKIEGYKYLTLLLLPRRGEFSLAFPLLKASLLINVQRNLAAGKIEIKMLEKLAKWTSGTNTPVKVTI